MHSRQSSSTGSFVQDMSQEINDAVQMQTRAADTRRKMTERYHAAVVRGRHPRSFPRDSALWVHAKESKQRQVRLQRGQSLASVVGGDRSVFSQLSFQGSTYSAVPGHEDPSYHPQHSAWSSQQGSLDLGAPPGTAGMGMFPPVYGGSAPGTQESQFGTDEQLTPSQLSQLPLHEQVEERSNRANKSRQKIAEDQRVKAFQFGRRMSIARTKANKQSHASIAAEAAAKSRQGVGRNQRKSSNHRNNNGNGNRSLSSSGSQSSMHSVTPAEAVAMTRANTRQSRQGTANTRTSTRTSTRGQGPMGLGANLSGINLGNDASKGSKATSPYEEDTIPEFTDSPQVSVFYGSTIALQMSDGRYLSVEEDSGKITCRHWPDVEDIGIRQQSTHPKDPKSVPARCLLTLTNLKDVHNSDPIHYGDPVYLVVASGSGIPDWKHGSLIGAQIEHAPDLGTVGLTTTSSCIRNPTEVNDDIGEVHAMPTVIPHAVMNKKAATKTDESSGNNTAKPIWLPGPVTPENETGWYSKKDPLYDKLWKDRNRVPVVVGRWVFMPNKEKLVGGIRRSKASKEARSSIDRGHAEGGKTEPVRIELNNFDDIYLEQDWFYLSQDPDDHTQTCLRQLPGTNKDGAEVAREAVKNGIRRGKSSPPPMVTKAGKRRDPPMPGDVVERRGLWKIRVVGVNNAAPKGAKSGTSRQDAIERTLYKARKQLKRSGRMREGKNRTYQNGQLKGGQQFARQIRQQQQNVDMEVDDRYLSHEEDKMHQLAEYFEARMRSVTEQIPLFDPPDPASVRMKQRLMQLQQQGSQYNLGGMGGSRMSSRSRWSLDGGGSGLLPQHEAMMGLGGHYLKHSLGLHNLSEATKIPVDLYPEDRLISGRLRKEDDKVDRYERAKENHHEKFGVFGSSIEMPNAIELAAPIPLEPLLGEWAHGVPKGDGGAKQRLKDLFAKEDETMQGALRYAARKDHSTLTAELSQDVRNT